MRKNLSFQSLWLGQAFLQLGLGLYILGMVTLLYTLTQSILWTTLFPIIRFGCSWLSGMLAPLIMQRIPLRSLLISTHLLQALLLMGLAFYLSRGEGVVSVILVFTAVISFLEGWGTPSRSAMIPRIIKKENLVRANSVVGTSNQISLCMGYVSGGRIAATFGSTNTLWISLLLISLCVLCFIFIKDSSNERSKQRMEQWEVLKETWSFVCKHPLYRRLFALDSIEYIAGSAWAGSIMLVFVQDVLHKNEAWWGYIHGTYLLGTVIGGFTALWMNQWLKKHLKLAFIVGSANLGILTIFFAYSPHPLLSMVFAILMGIPYQMRDIALQTLLQTNAETSKLPQIFSVHTALISISIVIGIVLMGFIAKFYGAQSAVLFSGVLVLLSAVMARSLPKINKQISTT